MSLKILTNYVAIFAGAIPDERIDFIIVNGNVDIQIRYKKGSNCRPIILYNMYISTVCDIV